MRQDRLVCVIGTRRYAVERPWGRLPEGVSLGNKSKIACDSKGNVFLLQRTDPPVIVFDSEGNYLRSWGGDLLADAHGIFIDSGDRVWIVDRDSHQVLVCSADGRLLWTLGERHAPRTQAPFNHPTDVAVAPDGDIYVADGYANTCVHRFASDGALKQSWGEPGSGPGQFTTPHGIRVLTDGRVLVGDRENDRVQVFSSDGRWLASWTGFFHPMDIHVDAEGLVYVSDQIPRVTVLRDDGSVVGRCRPVLMGGHGMTGDAAGNLYFCETRWPDLTKLTPID